MEQQTDLALDQLCHTIRDTQELLDRVLERADRLKAARAAGKRYADVVTHEDRPLVVEMLSQVLDALATAGSTFRRAEARSLHAEGLSQEAIAQLFGVTRQRVSVLLHEPPARR